MKAIVWSTTIIFSWCAYAGQHKRWRENAGHSYPVEGHVRGMLEWSVVGVAHHHDVAVARRTRRTQCLERALGVGTVTCQGGGYLQGVRTAGLGSGGGGGIEENWGTSL